MHSLPFVTAPHCNGWTRRYIYLPCCVRFSCLSACFQVEYSMPERGMTVNFEEHVDYVDDSVVIITHTVPICISRQTCKE